jgi:aerobic-type carbon monoxide dehydrogenase small subunit (CoxS/CutS family)
LILELLQGGVKVEYSRRNFMKAAGVGAAALTSTVSAVVAASQPGAAAPKPPPLEIPTPMTKETSTFNVNGKNYQAEYEARTTLWEVIAVKLGLTGTNRSCNRASCGACSVLLDGTPFYSCHTLAIEAVDKKIFTVEGLGDEKNLHPLQRVAHAYVAAECGFCTPGWEVTAKGLLDQNPNPSEEQVKEALAGHICRCAAYASIIRTVVDTGKVLRGEAEIA